MTGDQFTTAAISVTYALMMAKRNIGYALGQAYLARTTGRAAYARALETCRPTKAWWGATPG